MTQGGGRIALVTGANKGIGLEIARQLGQAGVTVFLGARDKARGEAAAEALRSEGLRAVALRLDVTDALMVRNAATSIQTRCGRLDILVNNAGIVEAGDGPPSGAALAAVHSLFETNFFGALTVVQAMLPLLRQSSAGRIINMSSSLGSLAMNGDPSSPYYAVRQIGYNTSKAALNMLTVLLSAELRDSLIVVNSVCPGYVDTDLSGHRGILSPAEAARMPVRLALLGEQQLSGKFLNVDGEIPW
jgi:NAD(P)-dependent dehydrogenase (short-subunit alcohol dehydrogenase family)